jgi:hypothetical protein
MHTWCVLRRVISHRISHCIAPRLDRTKSTMRRLLLPHLFAKQLVRFHLTSSALRNCLSTINSNSILITTIYFNHRPHTA